MESKKYTCNNCGAPVEANVIDFKTRRAFCRFCQKWIIFPKRTSTASPSATHAINEAVDLFLQSNFSSAKSGAETALTMVPKNIPALYIIGYCDAFVTAVKTRTALNNLFNSVIVDADFEIEEEENFKKLLKATLLHSMDYEAQIVTRFNEIDNPQEIAEFVESFTPLAVSKRKLYSWLTPTLAQTYKNIASRAKIPKTLFALLKSIESAEDSPVRNNSFYLKTQSYNFFVNYVEPIGEILKSYCDPEFRAKFVAVFKKSEEKFRSNMILKM